ncbi:MAG TPA: enoyl-CoA hydratase/isomerase family protein [Bacteroidetes bacterium]|nr:enoyl-CoA hydratase/isomerase family protein [Bacteroidota bacterium]
MDFDTVKLHILDSSAHIILNRPDRRNAFNRGMIGDLTRAFRRLVDHSCRSIVLTGEGPAFSAGADLEYMHEIKVAGEEENLADAHRLSDLLELIYTHPKPVIARVNGPAVGGGVGLVAACDIAVAVRGAFFAFSEVRLGLVPAVIGPYVVRKIGESAARRYMLTGERFNAEEAQRIGLVHHVAVQGDLDQVVHGIATAVSLGGPEALAACKELIHRSGEEPLQDVSEWTTRLITRLREGEEGQEGMESFLEKRDPRWQTGR